MKMKFFSLIILSITFMCFWLPPMVSAEANHTNFKGLTISPLRSELEIAPGTSIDGTLTITNSTDNSMVVNLDAEEFSVINQHYDYAFTAESDVSKWVTFSSSEVNLAAGGSKNISFTIGVPLSAEPGGRYISLFASTNANSQNDGIISKQRIASLLYITISGDVTRSGNLISLTSPRFITSSSKWSVAIQNTGTTHFRSRYNITVQSIMGHNTVASLAGDALILPGSVRVINDNTPLPKLPGVYKLIYTIGLGDTAAKVETYFMLYLPFWSMWAMAVAVLILTVILSIKRRRSKY